MFVCIFCKNNYFLLHRLGLIQYCFLKFYIKSGNVSQFPNNNKKLSNLKCLYFLFTMCLGHDLNNVSNNSQTFLLYRIWFTRTNTSVAISRGFDEILFTLKSHNVDINHGLDSLAIFAICILHAIIASIMLLILCKLETWECFEECILEYYSVWQKHTSVPLLKEHSSN